VHALQVLMEQCMYFSARKVVSLDLQEGDSVRPESRVAVETRGAFRCDVSVRPLAAIEQLQWITYLTSPWNSKVTRPRCQDPR
jgi:hypothetical protein